jgi:hypothetical protein
MFVVGNRDHNERLLMPHNNAICMFCENRRRTSPSRVECSVELVGLTIDRVPVGKGVNIVERGERGECPIGKIKYPNKDNPDALKPGPSPEPPKPIPRGEWPWYVNLIAFKAAPEDVGAGDTVYRLIGSENSENFQVAFKETFGIDCGCDVRRGDWNVKYPYERAA